MKQCAPYLLGLKNGLECILKFTDSQTPPKPLLECPVCLTGAATVFSKLSEKCRYRQGSSLTWQLGALSLASPLPFSNADFEQFIHHHQALVSLYAKFTSIGVFNLGI